MPLARLDKIDPEFRKLTDQLFFTDRMDIDLTGYEAMLSTNRDNMDYLWDRLLRSMEMFWEEPFWIDRFSFLWGLLDKTNLDRIESNILSSFNRLITHNYGSNPKVNNEYIQIMAWSKMKSARKENITPLREYLLTLPNIIYADRLKDIVSNFIPSLFNDLSEYVGILSKRVGQSARNFQLLKHLEQQGFPVDKSAINKLCQDLLFKRVPNRKNRRSFFAMLEDASVKAHIKSEYKPENRDRLVAFVKACDYKEIEEYHLRNIGNLLNIDASIADDLLMTYADRLYARGTGDKGANIKRLIRACKTYPQFSPKKVLVYLSANNRMPDIKKLVAAFHDLKTLVPFI